MFTKTIRGSFDPWDLKNMTSMLDSIIQVIRLCRKPKKLYLQIKANEE